MVKGQSQYSRRQGVSSASHFSGPELVGEQPECKTPPEELLEQPECKTLPEELIEQPECKTLPEELVQRIVAMVPYPYIFKARTLSKSWRSRFSVISSIEDEEEKRNAKCFQQEVCEWSHRWDTFCPVSLGDTLGMDYTMASRNRANCLPSLSFLPRNVSTRLLNLDGPLLCGYRWLRKPTFSPDFSVASHLTLFIANILTRSWKQLPPLPNAGRNDVIFWKKMVRDPTLSTYKMIVLTGNARGGCSLQTYDSRTGAWKNQDFDQPTDMVALCNRPVYLNGVLYIPNGQIDTLMAFHVEEETWEKIILTPSVQLAARGLSLIHLVVCNGRLFRIELVGNFLELMRTAFPYGRVMEIDLATRRLLVVDNYSPRHFNNQDVTLRPFNVDGNRESSALCFQPGLNPFAEV